MKPSFVETTDTDKILINEYSERSLDHSSLFEICSVSVFKNSEEEN